MTDIDLLHTEDDDEESGTKELNKTDNEIESAYLKQPFRIVYQSYNYFVPQIKSMIDNKDVLNLRPEYQRRLRWTSKQKSLLIESLLLNIPIPAVFFYETDMARYEVMDGQQRLNAIYEYVSNGYRLKGLEKLLFLNGKSYQELPPILKRGLDRSSISAIILLQETARDETDPYLVRRHVFERLNTGGKSLSHQEIRNCIYLGEFNDMIIELTRDNIFCKIFNIPEYTDTDTSEYYESAERQKNTLYKTMKDCEIVLRFFALMDENNISGTIRVMLDNCMENNKILSEEKKLEYSAVFKKVIKTAHVIFGDDAFTLSPDDKGLRRRSVTLYDAVMISLYKRIDGLESIALKAEDIKIALDSYTSNADNKQFITVKANTAVAVKGRIEAVGEIIDTICR